LIFLDELEAKRIWYDKDKLEKIITNLITNALKFTKHGGKVEVVVRLSESNEWIEILVRDTGIGINQELLQHIFDPFYQIHFLAHQPFGGSGIGLALVKELLQLHKGKIEVNSIPGKGSEFIASIPINEKVYAEEDFLIAIDDFVLFDIKADVEIKEVAIPITGAKKEKGLLLLVDDNMDMRHYIRTHMEQDYRVVEASDGSEGLMKAMEMVPDIVIADVMMPHMNGLEMTSFLKNNELTSHIPILLLTAKASTTSVMEGLETNADDYVTKPFKMNELRIRVHNLVINRQTLRERYSKNSWLNPGKVESLSIDEQFLKKALLVVEHNMDEPDFDMLQFSQALGMSRTQIHRKLTALTGVSATGFIRTIRLKRAAQLLKQRSGSVSEIAYQTGFINLSYFTKSFKELFGQMPSEYVG
jgi:DNA-binding response OmpR family regulator